MRQTCPAKIFEIFPPLLRMRFAVSPFALRIRAVDRAQRIGPVGTALSPPGVELGTLDPQAGLVVCSGGGTGGKGKVDQWELVWAAP